MSAPEDEACWPEPAVDRPYLQVGDHRPHDRLGRLVPRNPFDGLTLAHAIPGFLGLWSKSVPPEHVILTTDAQGRSKRLVWCSCGMTTPLASRGPTACVGVFWRDDGEELDYAGPCTRFFLATSRDVRVRRFEREAV
jgi:hypothetical protein